MAVWSETAYKVRWFSDNNETSVGTALDWLDTYFGGIGLGAMGLGDAELPHTFIPGTTNWTELSTAGATMTYSADMDLFEAGTNNRLRFNASGVTPPPSGFWDADMTLYISMSCATQSRRWEISFAVNGTPMAQSEVVKSVAETGQSQTTGIVFPMSIGVTLAGLNNGDEISAAIQSNHAAQSYQIHSFLLNAKAIPDLRAIGTPE